MNKEQFQGKWNEIKGEVKKQWGKLTDDDLTQIQGNKDKLVGILQQRYGIAKEKAEQEIENWENSCSACKEEKVKPKR